jgi:hypothetical protein
VFHLKCNHNYNSVCKLWLHQYNRINESFFFRKNLQNSFTADTENVRHLLEDNYPPFFGVFRATLRSVSESVFAPVCSVLCFSSSKLRGLFEKTLGNEHTFCSWIHHVCTCTGFASGLNSGLATRVTLTWVSRGRLGESITRGGLASDFIFIPYYVIVVG